MSLGGGGTHVSGDDIWKIVTQKSGGSRITASGALQQSTVDWAGLGVMRAAMLPCKDSVAREAP
jgi:hypothetical protein